jgi:hypothetical protein
MDSPFHERLLTNYAPDDYEIGSIRTHLASYRDKLAGLETLIRDLSAQRDHLKLKDYVDTHEALLSPARRLPHDVVQEIFLAWLPSHRNAVMSPAEAPLLGLLRMARDSAINPNSMVLVAYPSAALSSADFRCRGIVGAS